MLQPHISLLDQLVAHEQKINFPISIQQNSNSVENIESPTDINLPKRQQKKYGGQNQNLLSIESKNQMTRHETDTSKYTKWNTEQQNTNNSFQSSVQNIEQVPLNEFKPDINYNHSQFKMQGPLEKGEDANLFNKQAKFRNQYRSTKHHRGYNKSEDQNVEIKQMKDQYQSILQKQNDEATINMKQAALALLNQSNKNQNSVQNSDSNPIKRPNQQYSQETIKKQQYKGYSVTKLRQKYKENENNLNLAKIYDKKIDHFKSHEQRFSPRFKEYIETKKGLSFLDRVENTDTQGKYFEENWNQISSLSRGQDYKVKLPTINSGRQKDSYIDQSLLPSISGQTPIYQIPNPQKLVSRKLSNITPQVNLPPKQNIMTDNDTIGVSTVEDLRQQDSQESKSKINMMQHTQESLEKLNKMREETSESLEQLKFKDIIEVYSAEKEQEDKHKKTEVLKKEHKSLEIHRQLSNQSGSSDNQDPEEQPSYLMKIKSKPFSQNSQRSNIKSRHSEIKLNDEPSLSQLNEQTASKQSKENTLEISREVSRDSKESTKKPLKPTIHAIANKISNSKKANTHRKLRNLSVIGTEELKIKDTLLLNIAGSPVLQEYHPLNIVGQNGQVPKQITPIAVNKKKQGHHKQTSSIRKDYVKKYQMYGEVNQKNKRTNNIMAQGSLNNNQVKNKDKITKTMDILQEALNNQTKNNQEQNSRNFRDRNFSMVQSPTYKQFRDTLELKQQKSQRNENAIQLASNDNTVRQKIEKQKNEANQNDSSHSVHVHFEQSLNQPMIYITSNHPQEQKQRKSKPSSKIVQIDMDIVNNQTLIQNQSNQDNEIQGYTIPPNAEVNSNKVYQPLDYLKINTLEGQKVQLTSIQDYKDQVKQLGKQRQQVKKIQQKIPDNRSKVRGNSGFNNNNNQFNTSHFQIKQKFNKFKEYVEHVSPELYHQNNRQQQQQPAYGDDIKEKIQNTVMQEIIKNKMMHKNSDLKKEGIFDSPLHSPTGHYKESKLKNNTDIIQIQDYIQDKLISQKDLISNDVIKIDQQEYKQLRKKQRGSLPVQPRGHRQDAGYRMQERERQPQPNSQADKIIGPSGLSGHSIASIENQIQQKEKNEISRQRAMINQQNFQKQQQYIKQQNEMISQEKHKIKLKLSDMRSENTYKQTEYNRSLAESDMNSVMMQIQLAKGQIDSPLLPKRGGLEMNQSNLEYNTSQTKALHQIGVKKELTNEQIKNNFNKNHPQINAEIEHSLQLMNSLSQRQPGPNADLQYYQRQIQLMQSMNEQLISQQAQEAYYLERKEEAFRNKSRKRKRDNINHQLPVVSKKINDELNTLLEDNGQYIDQIQFELSKDAEIINDAEDSRMNWFGDDKGFKEWDETEENDQCIKKINLKNYAKKSKNKAKKLEQENNKSAARKVEKVQEGGNQQAPHVDLSTILSNEQNKSSQLKGAKIQQTNSRLIMKQSSSQALLIGSQLTPSPGLQFQHQSPLPSPTKPIQKTINIKIPYKSPYKIDKGHIQRHMKYRNRVFNPKIMPDLQHIYNPMLQQMNQGTNPISPPTSPQRSEQNSYSPAPSPLRVTGEPSEASDDTESRPNTGSSQEQQGKSDVGHKYYVNLKIATSPNNKNNVNGVEFGPDSPNSPPFSPHFKPFEIEDITTWIERKREQVAIHKFKHQQEQQKYKIA